MILIEKLNKSFGKQTVLKNIELEMKTGQCIALVGPNGSGKTTLIKSILGMVLPDSGDIFFQGKSVLKQCEYRNQIGYMPQISRFPEHMSVGQLFNMIQSLRPDVSQQEYDTELYEQFNIEQMKHKSLGLLSGGMRQKVNAALSFLFAPKALILDEPTAGLDPISNEHLKKKVNKVVNEQKLVIITSHVLSDLDEIASELIYLINGAVSFHKNIDTLKRETSETKLNNIIAQILTREQSHA